MARGRRARQLGSRRRFAIRCSLLQLRVRGRLDLGFGASARAGRAVEAVLLWAAALTFSCKAGPSLRFARGQAPSLRTTTSGSFPSLRSRAGAFAQDDNKQVLRFAQDDNKQGLHYAQDEKGGD